MIDWGKKEVSDDPDWKNRQGLCHDYAGQRPAGPGPRRGHCQAGDGRHRYPQQRRRRPGHGLGYHLCQGGDGGAEAPDGPITVVSGDTDSACFDTGAYASSGTFFSGNASLLAAKKLKEKILAEAALQMNEKVEDLDVAHPARSIPRRYAGAHLRRVHPATSGDGTAGRWFPRQLCHHASSVPYGAHLRRWRSTSGTGEIKVQKFYALQDAGTPINPRSRCARCTVPR